MSHYDVLGIGGNASDGDIKKAFFRLVRKFPPEKEPTKYKEIRAAYETLSDVGSRRQYDSLLKHGGEIAELRNRAEAAATSEDWVGCSRLLKKILVLNPDESATRFELAFCCSQSGDFEGATKQLDQLVKQAPEVARYWSALGQSLRQQAKQEGISYDIINSLRNRARKSFLQAIELEKVNSEAYVGLAGLYVDEDSIDKAIKLLEKAILADGKVDFQDFETFLFLCVLHSRQENWPAMSAAVDRLLPVVPDDADAKEYVAARFMQLAAIAVENGALKASEIVARAATRFVPGSQKHLKFANQLGYISRAVTEFDDLKNDSAIAQPLKALVAIILMIETGEERSEEVGIQRLDQAFDALGTYSIVHVRDSLRRLRSRYPNCFMLREDMFSRILTDVEQAPTPTASSTSSGCVWLFAVILPVVSTVLAGR